MLESVCKKTWVSNVDWPCVFPFHEPMLNESINLHSFKQKLSTFGGHKYTIITNPIHGHKIIKLYTSLSYHIRNITETAILCSSSLNCQWFTTARVQIRSKITNEDYRCQIIRLVYETVSIG